MLAGTIKPSSTEPPTRFPIARLTLEARAEGTGSVIVGTNAVGWSLDGSPLDYSLDPGAQIEILPLPEPSTAAAIAWCTLLLGSFARSRRRNGPRDRCSC